MPPAMPAIESPVSLTARPADSTGPGFPEWMGIATARPGVHAAVHAGQLDEAAQRDRPDGIQRLAALPTQQLGAEPDAELLNLDARELGRQEMTGFVHDDEPAEDQDDEGDEDDGTHAGSLLRTLLVPPEEARTCARAQRSAALTASSVSSSSGSALSTACRTDGTISTNRRCPLRKRATASSFAAFSTAGAVPPRSPASQARATAG